MTTTNTTERPTPAARRRRLGLGVAMVGTLTGLAVSLATPAMAASGAPAASAPTAVVTTASSHAHHAGAPRTDPGLAAPKTARLEAFRGAGYDYADAQALASLWESPSPYDAKLTGGAKIKAGLTLPFPPEADPETVEGTSLTDAKLGAFRGAGYDYADAQALASLWESPSPYDAKLTGGAKIKAGLTLPFPPEAAPGASSGHHA